MKLSPEQLAEANDLLWALRAGTSTPEQLARLEQQVRENPAFRAFYVRYMHLCADLHWNHMAPIEESAPGIEPPTTNELLPAPHIVVDLSSPPAAARGWFSTDGTLLSYAVSTLVVAVGLMIGWTCEISPLHDVFRDLAHGNSAPRPVELPVIGRVAGTADCQWAESSPRTVEGAPVLPGHQYALASGLLEIAYDSGARVILQGPCRYVASTPGSGYLAEGKLTVLVEKKAETTSPSLLEGHIARETTAAHESPVLAGKPLPAQPVTSVNADNSPPANHQPAGLFCVRTPTAVITDLGTEFAVEVDASGTSRTHVFRGKAEVRALQNREESVPIPLEANESASVAHGEATPQKMAPQAFAAQQFARRMPKRIRLDLFNTGAGLKEGDSDPHWQFVARTDQPTFQPCAAHVIAVDSSVRLPNDPARSQWISLERQLTLLPDDVVFTLRTTFDLTGTMPRTAVLVGRFLVDDHIKAIRLNGQPVDWQASPEEGLFFSFRVFRITKGFVAGLNVLELDILNGSYASASPGSQSCMACCIELEGSAMQDPHSAPPAAPNNAPSPPKRQGERALSHEKNLFTPNH